MKYSLTHNVCVYEGPNPQRIVAAAPQAVLLDAERVVVPCDIINMQAMRYLGYQALSPMLRDYDWPIRPPLRPFDKQRATAAFLTLHPRAFCLNAIGTGKTLSALWALDYLMRCGHVKKALILSPLSTLETVWLNEIAHNFLSRRKGLVVYGSRKKRLRLLNENADFYIINHDGLGVGCSRANGRLSLGEIAETIRTNPDFNAVVMDEGSVYKDSGTLRYKIFRQVALSKSYLWWLTGTPTPNEPVDAWAQARLVNTAYQESQKNFKARTMYQISTFKWLPKKDAQKTVAEILQPAIRFDRADFIDLPPLMTTDRQVEFTPVQRKAYDELKKQLRVMLKDGGAINAVNEVSLRLKLIQISCGAVYDEAHAAHKVDCAPRVAALREVIEECGEKLLVFAPLTSVINMLYDELKVDYSVEVINGAVSAGKRAEVFRDFQNATAPKIIIADPRTMAHGLTLTAASTIVWYGPTDQPEIYQQANGRINRPGQTKSMLVVRLMATAIEREIYRRLDGKQGLQGSMLDIIRGEDVGL